MNLQEHKKQTSTDKRGVFSKPRDKKDRPKQIERKKTGPEKIVKRKT